MSQSKTGTEHIEQVTNTQSRTCCTPCKVHNCCLQLLHGACISKSGTYIYIHYSTNTVSVPCCIWSALATTTSEVLAILAFGRVYKVAIQALQLNTLSVNTLHSACWPIYSQARSPTFNAVVRQACHQVGCQPMPGVFLQPSQTSSHFLQRSLVWRPVLQCPWLVLAALNWQGWMLRCLCSGHTWQGSACIPPA